MHPIVVRNSAVIWCCIHSAGSRIRTYEIARFQAESGARHRLTHIVHHLGLEPRLTGLRDRYSATELMVYGVIVWIRTRVVRASTEYLSSRSQ